MTPPDLAAMFSHSHATLVSGKCSCIFHNHCAKQLLTVSGYACKQCRATTEEIISITSRNCLICKGYSKDVFCPLCMNSFLTLLRTKSYEHAYIDITYALETILKAHSVKDYLVPIYNAWIQLYLRKYPTSLIICILHERMVVINPKNFFRHIWFETVKANGSFNMTAWIDTVSPRLQALNFFELNTTVEEVMRIDKELRMDPVAGIVSIRNLSKYNLNRISYPVKGRKLFTENQLEAQNDLVRCGHVNKIFLPHLNDYMYYIKIPDSNPIEVDFQKKWLLLV